jgi:hypothetical protein
MDYGKHSEVLTFISPAIKAAVREGTLIRAGDGSMIFMPRSGTPLQRALREVRRAVCVSKTHRAHLLQEGVCPEIAAARPSTGSGTARRKLGARGGTPPHRNHGNDHPDYRMTESFLTALYSPAVKLMK